MRILFVSIAAFCLGCTVTPDGGTGGAFATSGSGGSSEQPDAEESESAAPEPGDSSEGDSSGWATFGSVGTDGLEEGSSSGGSSSSTGAPVDSGPDEPGGAYAACDTSEDCGMEPPGLACLHADENGAGGFCSPPCGTYGATPPDSSLCPESPAGVSATVVCLEGLVRNCALACQDDGDCPENTACLMANGGSGPYCFGV
jgi:hypothetical protein